MKVVLIPIKDPFSGKGRLAGYLSHRDRRLLVWAMIEDVLEAACSAQRPDGVVVVSSSTSVCDYAKRSGCRAIKEACQESESLSVDDCSYQLQREGVGLILRIPADIPLLEASDIDRLLERPLGSGAALLVPSLDGRGTNALLRTPPNAFPSRFGPDSFCQHKREALQHGVDLAVVENLRISLDLDEISDLVLFKGLATRTHTAELVERLPVLPEGVGLGNQ